MPECFCGCGDDIKGFGPRGAHKMGLKTVPVNDKLRAARVLCERTPRARPLRPRPGSVADAHRREARPWRRLGSVLGRPRSWWGDAQHGCVPRGPSRVVRVDEVRFSSSDHLESHARGDARGAPRRTGRLPTRLSGRQLASALRTTKPLDLERAAHPALRRRLARPNRGSGFRPAPGGQFRPALTAGSRAKRRRRGSRGAGDRLAGEA